MANSNLDFEVNLSEPVVRLKLLKKNSLRKPSLKLQLTNLNQQVPEEHQNK